MREGSRVTSAAPDKRSAIKAKTKKRVILEYWAARALERAGAQEIRAIQAEVRRQFGPEVKAWPSYIASVLGEAGVRVDLPARFDDRFIDPRIEEPYASRLKGVLEFRDLETAEAALRKLNALYQEYLEACDRKGAELVRSIVLKGKQRAASLSASLRVTSEKRREKQEIAAWFRVWLETPDLFFDWLEVRKQSVEFQHAFGVRRA